MQSKLWFALLTGVGLTLAGATYRRAAPIPPVAP